MGVLCKLLTTHRTTLQQTAIGVWENSEQNETARDSYRHLGPRLFVMTIIFLSVGTEAKLNPSVNEQT